MLGPLAAFSTSAIWAYASPRYAKITVDFGPVAVNLSRALAALLVATMVLAIRAVSTGSFASFNTMDIHSVAWLSLSMLTSYGLGDALFFVAASKIGFATALAIGSSFPLWSACAGWWFRGEVLSVDRLAGLALLVGGVVAIVALGRNEHAKKPGTYLRWVVLSIFVSLLWSATAFFTSQSTMTADPTLATAIRMAAAIPIIFGVSFFLKRVNPKPFYLPGRVFWRSFPLFAVEGFGGALAYVYGMSHTDLAVGSALSSLAPVLSVPFAVLLGLDRPSIPRMTALIGVVVGIWLLV